VAALDQHVGGHHQPATSGRREHRGVVADADLDARAGAQPAGQAGDQPELTER